MDAAAPQSEQRTGRLSEVWRYFQENRGAVIGLWVFAGFVLVALLADLIAPYDPIAQFREHLLQPPFWRDGESFEFALGTDAVGRDLLSRLPHGARFSFHVGVVVVAVAASGGILIGLAAGFAPKWLDTIIMQVMDIILAFPSLLLALVLVAILGFSLTKAMIAIVLQPHYVSLAQASALSERTKDYVAAARVTGVKLPRLMFITVLPNCLSPIIVLGALSFSTAILDVAALGFLGMGAQPRTPERGTTPAEAREFILGGCWVMTFPGLAILIAVLAINLMGDGQRDALDPKLKRG